MGYFNLDWWRGAGNSFIVRNNTCTVSQSTQHSVQPQWHFSISFSFSMLLFLQIIEEPAPACHSSLPLNMYHLIYVGTSHSVVLYFIFLKQLALTVLFTCLFYCLPSPTKKLTAWENIFFSYFISSNLNNAHNEVTDHMYWMNWLVNHI